MTTLKIPMNEYHSELWRKIQNFSLDDLESCFCFSDRLARENRWTKEFALAVVEEYRKFIFLACVADHQVTPSIQVDEAWHLHLIYTRSYWEDLCKDTLGRTIHHGPTKGGNAEDTRYERQYRKTLDSYLRYFGKEAPKDIWPEPHERFRRDIKNVRVDLSRNWVIPKPAGLTWLSGKVVPIAEKPKRRLLLNIVPVLRVFVLLTLISLVLVEFAFAGDSDSSARVPFSNPIRSLEASSFLMFYAILGVGILVFDYFVSELDGESEISEGELKSANLTSLLEHDPAAFDKVALASISRILNQRSIECRERDGVKTYTPGNADETKLNAIDRAALEAVERAATVGGYITHDDLIVGLKSWLNTRRSEQQTGIGTLFHLPIFTNYPKLASFALYLIFLAIGIGRLYVGLSKGRPVGFLCSEIVVFSLLFFASRSLSSSQIIGPEMVIRAAAPVIRVMVAVRALGVEVPIPGVVAVAAVAEEAVIDLSIQRSHQGFEGF